MNSRRLLAVVVLALLVALALALPVSATDKKFDPPKKHVTILKATLTGEQEVPGPGDRDGFGRAVVKVFKTKVCYALKVKRIKPAEAAHIHLGFRGEAGPIVVTLEPPTDGFSRGCVEIPRALSLGLMEHPSRYYVNVHNEPFPAGAIRGQLHR